MNKVIVVFDLDSEVSDYAFCERVMKKLLVDNAFLPEAEGKVKLLYADAENAEIRWDYIKQIEKLPIFDGDLKNANFFFHFNFLHPHETFDFSSFTDYLLFKQRYNSVSATICTSGIKDEFSFRDKFSNFHLFLNSDYNEAGRLNSFFGSLLFYNQSSKSWSNCAMETTYQYSVIKSLFPVLPIDSDVFNMLHSKIAELKWDFSRGTIKFGRALVAGDAFSERTRKLLMLLAYNLLHKAGAYIREQIDFERLKKFSVMEYYLFAFFLHLNKNVNVDKKRLAVNIVKDIVERAMLDASSFSASLFQLVENICYHSDTRKGLMFFRAYGSHNKNILQSLYIDYELDVYGGDSPFEVILADNSEKNIISSFAKRYPHAKSFDLKEMFVKQDDFWKSAQINASQHLGLTDFFNTLKNCDGYFRVVSSDNTHPNASYSISGQAIESLNSIGGTKYSIVLPINKSIKQSDGHIKEACSADIRIDNYEVVNICADVAALQTVDGTQDKKNQSVDAASHALFSDIKQKLDEKKHASEEKKNIIIHLLPVETIGKTDKFAKCILKVGRALFESCGESNAPYNIAGIAVFIQAEDDYNNCCTVLQNSQERLFTEIFLYDGEANYGRLGSTSRVENVQVGQASKAFFDAHADRNMPYVPFELLINTDKGITVFEKYAQKKLCGNLLNGTGYMLEDTHVRLGSKVHIFSFFQAEILFQTTYFVIRFGHLLAQKVTDRHADKTKQLVLVGYETYSEMLMYITREILLLRGYTDVKYIIYNNETEKSPPTFNYLEKFAENAEAFIVVPINSTCTTFDKIRADLERNQIHAASITYLGCILIADSDPDHTKKYWIKDKDGKRSITLVSRNNASEKPDGKCVNYFIEAQAEWAEPLNCKKCFPENLVDERPLTATNKASVIPIEQFGENIEKDDKQIKHIIAEESENNLMSLLKRTLIFKHVDRNANHFQYYIQTEKLFSEICKDAQAKSQFEKKLLDAKKNAFKIADEDISVIIAPLHFSNTGFLQEVNKLVFGSKAIVLNIEVEKEYRDSFTVKNKFLFDSIKSNDKAKFYFVDDTIISGTKFYRARSLIQGNRTDKSKDVFDGVILLLNRVSNETKYNYISDTSRFFSFIDLHIPSLRVHDDACVLCNLASRAASLRDDSSGIGMINYWKAKNQKFLCTKELNGDNDKKQSRHFRRLVTTHTAHRALSGCNEEKQARKIIILLFEKDITIEGFVDKGEDQLFERFVSYVKSLTRPFLWFRNSIKKVIFKICLQFMQLVFFDDNSLPRDIEWLGSNLKKIVDKDKKKKKTLTVILLGALSQMGSNYLLRKRIIKKMQGLGDIWQGYLHFVKDLVEQGKDETKSLWLEHLLLTGDEDVKNAQQKEWCDRQTVEDLLVENTRVIRKASANLVKFEKSDNQNTESPYFFENFLRILKWNGFDAVPAEKIKTTMKEIYGCLDTNEKSSAVTSYAGKPWYETLVESAAKMSDDIESVLFFGNDDSFSQKEYAYYHIHSCSLGAQNAKKDTSPMVSEEDKQYATNSTIAQKGYLISETAVCIFFDNNYCDDAEKQKIHKIYLRLLLKPKVVFSKKLFFLRVLLSFKKQIVRAIEKDFNNNLFQIKAQDMAFIGEIKKTRALDHTGEDSIIDDLKAFYDNLPNSAEGVSVSATNIEDTAVKAESIKLNRRYFRLIINTYVGRFNTRILLRPFSESNMITPHAGAVYDTVGYGVVFGKINGLQKVFDLMTSENANDAKDRRVIFTNEKFEAYKDYKRVDFWGMEICPTITSQTRIKDHHLVILISTCILSALAHGKTEDDEQGAMKIALYQKDGYLIIKNKVDGVPLSGSAIQDALSRKGKGISMAVISDYFKALIKAEEMMKEESKLQQPTRQAEFVTIDGVKNDSGAFLVRLPILKKID